MVKDQDNETTFFNENEPGIYLSPNGFKGITGHAYTLFINTSDGESYQSESQTIIPGIVVDSLELLGSPQKKDDLPESEKLYDQDLPEDNNQDLLF